MEIRELAEGVLRATTLEGKLAPPPADLTDERPGPATRVEWPLRPEGLEIVTGVRVRVPRPAGMADPAQRSRILHALANHELQAAELFAWALLLFPDAPPDFRRGCVAIMRDEQAHCGAYLERLEALGTAFGDHPLTGHFWRKTPDVRTPLEFVCTLGLTFENANLDFTLEHAAAARAAGDEATAAVLDRVHRDETRHVAFAWRWFESLRDPRVSRWDAYRAAVAPPHGPERARGATFDRASREAAGLTRAFIERLARTVPTAPGGGRR